MVPTATACSAQADKSPTPPNRQSGHVGIGISRHQESCRKHVTWSLTLSPALTCTSPYDGRVTLQAPITTAPPI